MLPVEDRKGQQTLEVQLLSRGGWESNLGPLESTANELTAELPLHPFIPHYSGHAS